MLGGPTRANSRLRWALDLLQRDARLDGRRRLGGRRDCECHLSIPALRAMLGAEFLVALIALHVADRKQGAHVWADA
jgi:hypothetical protein